MQDQTQYLLIKSSDRQAGGTSSSFTIQLGGASLLGINKVRLVSANIPNTIYNIRTGVNDQIDWNHGGAFSFQIPAGSYTITNLLSTIQAGMIAADANNYAWTNSSTTGLVTVTGTGAFTLLFGTGTHKTASVAANLGFTAADTGSATTQTGTNVFNLSQPYYLYISINEFNTRFNFTNPLDRATFVIPINVNSFGIINYEDAVDFIQEYELNAPVNVSQLTVKLWIGNMEAANLNGSEWNMVLKLTQQNKYE